MRATLKGMALTFRHMFRPKVTMQYPEERSTDDVDHRPAVARHAPDADRRAGPLEVRRLRALSPDLPGQLHQAGARARTRQGNRYPLIYEIDEFRCVFCGYCQEVCPEEAIHVGVHYENAEYERGRFVYDLERLSAQTHPVSSLWDPTDPRGE